MSTEIENDNDQKYFREIVKLKRKVPNYQVCIRGVQSSGIAPANR